ncbi:Flp family type IVb pilin [Bosea sp. (in: a-proteobacteria)]|uniref:Flp family type IVb pilin n=1 Tax=Bosea sp. (in: a-proteobacteria) TaxID=1871050 RepID=UPI00333FDE13
MFRRDQRGTTAIEYGLVGVLVSLAIIAGAMQTGESVRGFLEMVQNAFLAL